MEGGVKELSLYRLSRAKEDLDSSKNDLCKGFLQVNITAGIFICSKQSRSNHYMMFRSAALPIIPPAEWAMPWQGQPAMPVQP